MATQVVSPIDGVKHGDNSPIGGMNSGGITPIPDAKHNPHIIDLARWAVDEYNKEHKTSLKFVKVDYAAQQVVSGMMYYITLEAANGGLMGVYEAKVWEQAWISSRKLVEFKQILPNA
ncbi:hypothetical protein BUALT_Bualt02G0173000 [Buddleja alternifolia]|uniref:Cysteine proteinase inhibitor n=1 Tax=Buddleja alternifolia TaxID=168488 RepID=A0AAV6Y0Z4_9LAMI|nr:hypothetical protein BUALT_Bualt02G0173000 [Buddleja alternifolia]